MIVVNKVDVIKEYPAPSPGNQLCDDGAFSLEIVVTPEYEQDKHTLNHFLQASSTKLLCAYTDEELTQLYKPDYDLYIDNEFDFFRKEGDSYIYKEWVSYNPITRAALAFMQEQVGKKMEAYNFVHIVNTFYLWWD